MKTNAEHIAVDIDEVLYPFVLTFVDEHNQLFGSSLSVDDFFTYEFEHVLNESVEETIRRVHLVHESGYDAREPIGDAKLALGRLALNHRLSVVTARNPRFEAETIAWLDRHFDGVFSDIVLLGHHKENGSIVTKADTCIRLGAGTLIDDSVSHLQICAERGLKGILFGDYPWNRGLAIPNSVVACGNWQEVLEYFESK